MKNILIKAHYKVNNLPLCAGKMAGPRPMPGCKWESSNCDKDRSKQNMMSGAKHSISAYKVVICGVSAQQDLTDLTGVASALSHINEKRT